MTPAGPHAVPRAQAGLRSATFLYVAAAGYGKTSALEAVSGPGSLCLRAADLAADLDIRRCPRSLAESVERRVVVDDVDQLPDQLLPRLALALSALPVGTQVSLASRRALPASALGVFRGVLRERCAADLALSADAVAIVLCDEHGLDASDLAFMVHEATGGWAALVHLAGIALGADPVPAGADGLADCLAEPGTPSASWLNNQVLAHLDDDMTQLLAAAVELEVQSADLHEHLGLLPPERARAAFGRLVRTGLMTAHSRYPSRSVHRVVPVVAAAVRRLRVKGRDCAAPTLLTSAAGWYAEHHLPLAAALALHRAGDQRQALDLVRARSAEMLAGGGAVDVARLLSRDGAGRGATAGAAHRELRMVLGDALRMSGDATEATRVFAPLVEQAERAGSFDVALARRVAALHYMRARYGDAARTSGRALAGCGESSADLDLDLVLLLACRAHAQRALGDLPSAGQSAARALAVAERLGSPQALAAAHLAVAGTLVGPARDDHLTRAQEAAHDSGDVVTLARVLVDRADCLLRSAQYEQAEQISGLAVLYAQSGSPPGILVTALHNAGEALLRLGRFEEAAGRFERSIAICRRVGLRRTAMGLWGLAEVHRQLGRREQSVTGFEAAIEVARETGELHVLLPAMHGLTCVLLDSATQLGVPDVGVDVAQGAGNHRRATEIVAAEIVAADIVAAESLRLAPPRSRLPALLALGRVALARGDGARARGYGAQAEQEARESRLADAVADALELVAAVASAGLEPQEGTSSISRARAARTALREALAIWSGSGAGPAADRVRVLLGRLVDAPAADRAAARAAARRLIARGVGYVDGRPVLLAEHAAGVQVRVLGGFDVLVGGVAVPLPSWKSRQARTLVKILVARRGRTVSRSELCELLWPDDEPQRTAHRLSVILSVVRGVLDPDRCRPPDHHIRADASGMSLDLAHVDVDVERLLADAAHAGSLLRSGELDRGYELLEEVDASYRGDAFDDDPFEDWADSLREQARSVWLRSLRHLARLSQDRGDDQHAATDLVRLLTADPYDDGSHRTLVNLLTRSGRHGEARRAFDRWTHSMRSIDAPLPDAALMSRHAALAGAQ